MVGICANVSPPLSLCIISLVLSSAFYPLPFPSLPYSSPLFTSFTSSFSANLTAPLTSSLISSYSLLLLFLLPLLLSLLTSFSLPFLLFNLFLLPAPSSSPISSYSISSPFSISSYSLQPPLSPLYHLPQQRKRKWSERGQTVFK